MEYDYLGIENVKDKATESGDIRMDNVKAKDVKGLHQLHKHSWSFFTKDSEAE